MAQSNKRVRLVKIIGTKVDEQNKKGLPEDKRHHQVFDKLDLVTHIMSCLDCCDKLQFIAFPVCKIISQSLVAPNAWVNELHIRRWPKSLKKQCFKSIAFSNIWRKHIKSIILCSDAVHHLFTHFQLFFVKKQEKSRQQINKNSSETTKTNNTNNTKNEKDENSNGNKRHIGRLTFLFDPANVGIDKNNVSIKIQTILQIISANDCS